MELAEVLRIIWSRKLLAVLVVLLAGGAAVGAGALAKATPRGAATVQILVDSPQSALADLQQNTIPLTTRATLFAQVMASEAVLEDIATAAAVPAGQLTAQGPYSGSAQSQNVITPSEARGAQLLGERAAYRLSFVAQADEPVVTASVQGPTAAAAGRVAAAIYPGLQTYVAALEKQARTARANRVTIRELGPPQAGTVNSSSRLTLMAVAALGVLLVGLLLLLGIEGLRRRTREVSVSHEVPRQLDLAADLAHVAGEERSRSIA
jgi:Chain length determinant protein